MRTTLGIDDTVLAAARSLARRGISIGAALSELARRGLASASSATKARYSPFPVLHGDPDHVVTDELVDHFRDDD